MTTKETKADLKTFDSSHLEKLRIMFYDRWTFETGSQADRDFLDAIEAELESRDPQPKQTGTFHGLVAGQGCSISSSGNDGMTEISVELRAEYLKFNDENLFIKSKYGLRFSHVFERELRRVAREELSKLLLKM